MKNVVIFYNFAKTFFFKKSSMILKQLKLNGIEAAVIAFIICALAAVSAFTTTTVKYISLPENGTHLFNAVYNYVFNGQITFFTQIVALILILAEALLVTAMNTNHELTRAKNIFFLFVYIILSLSYIPLNTFLPEQIANIFITLGFVKILSSHGLDKAEFHFFDAGLLFGVSALFCTSAMIMLLIGLIAFINYRPYKFNEFAVYIIGFFTPFFIYLSIFYLIEGNLTAIEEFYRAKFTASLNLNIKENELISFISYALMIFLASVFIMQEYRKYNLFSTRTYRMFFIMFACILILVMTPYFGLQSLRLMTMPLTMLYVTVFYNFKQTVFSEVFFTVFLLVHVGIQGIWYAMP